MEKSAKQHYVEKPAEIKTTSTGQQALWQSALLLSRGH